MENVIEKMIDELWSLKNKIVYDMSNLEFRVKVKGDTTFTTDYLFKVYKDMLHDIENLIDRLITKYS